MNSDQKLLYLINEVDALLKAADKADASNGSHLFTAEVKKRRRDLKTWICANRIVQATKPIIKRQMPRNRGGSNFNYLAM